MLTLTNFIYFRFESEPDVDTIVSPMHVNAAVRASVPDLTHEKQPSPHRYEPFLLLRVHITFGFHGSIFFIFGTVKQPSYLRTKMPSNLKNSI